MVADLVDALRIDRILDYGCGAKMGLRETLKPKRDIVYQAYDPGVPELAGEPTSAELVCCIDVLEHIEPDCLEDVLDHLEELTELVLFATVCTAKAKKTLPDGRNAHLIVEPMEWWLPKLWDRFHLQTIQRTSATAFIVIAHNRSLPSE